MSATFVQFLFAGLTVGAVYALIALGFSLVYNASHVINFAQGEFVMLGGLAAAFMVADGVPLGLAAVLAVLLAVAVALALYLFGIRPAHGASVVALIIVTIGASILIRGLAGIVFDRNFHSLPPISGEEPIRILGAVVAPQSLWVTGVTALVALALWLFFSRTLWGKAMLAAAWNPLAAELVGIDPRRVVLASFALAGALGALAGLLITPLAPTHFQVGTMLGLKGFAAAIVGGLGSGPGALVGGLVVGLVESFAAGYLSSAYKDAIAFVIILVALVVRPQGLLGRAVAERV
ncbi:High-affinity branched-chain amino acid transport system permease protein LivH [bacterium HR39]|nr:High-affinity branched-chain amino acid transport system permease protein LivH [bacterium HR39]